MEKTILLFIMSIWGLPVFSFGDETKMIGHSTLTLEDVIRIARLNSADAATALNELKAAYWEYRSFKADLLPEVSISGNMPTYSKQYNTYQTDAGSYTFVRSNYLETGTTIKAVQKIWPTGGTLQLSTSLNYLKQFGDGGEHRYMAIPWGLTLSQSLFGVNEVKWKQRIEPLRYREAKASFLMATEEVTMKAITHYFNLLLAKENLSIAQQNHENALKLFEVAKAKREMGRISDNDLLQIRLSLLQAESTLTNSQTQLNSCRFRLSTFLNISDSIDITSNVLSATAISKPVSYPLALEKAWENSSVILNIERRRLQADCEVATARGARRSIEVYASIGYTGQAQQLRQAYTPLKDYQMVEVGVNIPLLDWGKRRGKVKVAESNREMMQSLLRQEQMTFDQDLFILVEELNNHAKQLRIAEEADEIAQRRYQTNIATFMVGSISTLELNDAQNSKDTARKQRIQQLYEYWYHFYQLRSLTLWDFLQNRNIDADIEELIKK